MAATFKVLFDTNAISYWHGDIEEYRIPLEMLFKSFEKHSGLVYYVSTVSIQELAVWGVHSKKADEIERWVLARFNPLTFDTECAKKAAEIQANHARPDKRPGQTREEVKSEWHHDCAILGTAAQHSVNLIVTGEIKGWNRYRKPMLEMCGAELHILAPVPLSGGEADDPAEPPFERAADWVRPIPGKLDLEPVEPLGSPLISREVHELGMDSASSAASESEATDDKPEP